MNVNINAAIVVTLTIAGAETYNASPRRRKRVKAGEVLKVQLWDAFHIFGPEMYMTAQPQFVDNNMQIKRAR